MAVYTLEKLLRRTWLWVLMSLIATAVALGGPMRVAFAEKDYAIGPGDKIAIKVMNHPELDTSQRIGEEGKLQFSFLGDVQVTGLSEAALADKLERLLVEHEIANDPEVIVSVEEFRSQEVSLVGEVKKPGQYYLTGKNRTILDLLADGGWLTESAANFALVVHHTSSGTEEKRISLDDLHEGGAAGNLPVSPGDTIIVPKMEVFYVYGEVRKPGVYRLERGMTVMQAIAVAGGITDKGTERGLLLERKSQNDETTSVDAELSTPVQPKDVLRVKESLF